MANLCIRPQYIGDEEPGTKTVTPNRPPTLLPPIANPPNSKLHEISHLAPGSKREQPQHSPPSNLTWLFQSPTIDTEYVTRL